jgi:hypothetical protein
MRPSEYALREAKAWSLDECVRDIDFVRCGHKAVKWFIRDQPDLDGFTAVGLCGHCEWWWTSGGRSMGEWREATREEAEIWLIHNE